jgi:hypothetical protein
MDKRKPKQVDPIGENVQLDQAVMDSTDSSPSANMVVTSGVSPANGIRASTKLQGAFGDTFGAKFVGDHSENPSPIAGRTNCRILQEGPM